MDIFEAERVWGDALSNQSLVVQLEYDDELARKALQRIGYLIQRGDIYVVETGHMASLLVGLNLVASAELEQGALWAQIMSALNNLENNQGNQVRITKLHRAALNRFGLQRFEHPLGRIGEIILHAGIPVHSQKTFIQKLIREYRTVPNFDAAYFCNEVRSIPRERIQSKGLDAPTWHFINQAGEVAEDFVEKCIEVLDDLQDDGVLNSGGGQGLPKRVIDEIVRVVSELGSLRRAKSAARIFSPQIRWRSTELLALLPVLPENAYSQSIWTMDAQFHQSEIHVPRTMPGLAPTRASFEIREVTPNVSFVASVLQNTYGQSLNRRWNTKLFTEDAPVLIFKSDGSMDQIRGPIEPAVHRVLVRESYKGIETRIEVDGVTQLRRIDAPLGWGSGDSKTNWVAYELDLDGAELLAIFLGSDQKPAVKRPVSAYKKPQVRESNAVPGVFDQLGNPILSAPPNVTVPPSEGGDDIWTYRLTNMIDASILETSLTPDKGLLKPVFGQELDGSFEVSVSKGFGTGLKFNANIVTGLEISAREMRRLADDGKGLEKFSTTLRRGDFELELAFGSQDIETHLADSHVSAQLLVIQPTHESFELLNTSSLRKSTWFTPVKAHIEDLPDLQFYAALRDRVGVRLVGVSSDKTVIELAPKESASRLRFNLAELAETANHKGPLELHLLTDAGRNLAAGQVYPRKMFESFTFDAMSGELQFTFRSDTAPEGLEIAFYPSRAPWIKPIVIPLVGFMTSVPEEILGFGEAYFTIAIANPWVESVFPDIPDRSGTNTGRFDAGEIIPETSADHALAYWLTSGSQTQKLFSISLERAWQCMLLGNMQSGAIVNRVAMRDFAATILREQPSLALKSYPSELRDDEHYLKHLFTAGLLASSASTEIDISNYANKPVLACLLADESDENQMESLLALATAFWGLRNPKQEDLGEDDESLSSTLISKSRLFATVPQLFALWSEEEFESWFEEYVPGSLFEGGTMARIARDLAIEADAAHEVIDIQSLRTAIESLDEAFEGYPANVRELVATRPVATPETRDRVRKTRGLRIVTLDIPWISLRLALLVRLAARGDSKAMTTWSKHMYLHKQISTVSPSITELDLTLAELFLKLQETESNE
jgi:hypothetical protein